MKILVFSLFAILLATSTELKAGGGKCNGGAAAAARKAYLEAKMELEARKAQREREREAILKYMTPIDTDKDNAISLKEFIVAKASAGSKEAFENADTNRDRYLSKLEVGKMIGVDKMTSTSKKR